MKERRALRAVLPGGLTVLLTVLLVAGVLRQGLTVAPLHGDASLATYRAQTIAAGDAPYAGYISVQPPLAFVPGAIAIALGRALQVDDELCVRWAAVCLVAGSLWVMYALGKAFAGRRIVGALSAAALGWNLLITAATLGAMIKLQVVFWGLLVALAIQRRRWLWAGVATGCVLMSWAGAPVLLAVAPMAALLQREEPRRRAVGLSVAGILVVVAAVFAYLAIEGTWVSLWQQYILTIGRYVYNKVVGRGIYSPELGAANLLTRAGNLALLDGIVLLLGIAGLVIFMARPLRKDSSPWVTWSAPQSSGVLLPILFLGAGAAFDFQSPADLMPLVPYVALLAGWLSWHLIRLWSHWQRAPRASSVELWVATGLIVAVSLGRLWAISPADADGLANQRTAAAWIDLVLDGDNEIQVLGSPWPLVLTRRPNATRVSHLGPKEYLAMVNEGQTLEAFIAQLDGIRPSLIVVDPRNTKKSYMAPLMTWLEAEYEYAGEHLGTRVYTRRADARAYLAVAGFSYTSDQRLVMEGSLLAERGQTDAAEARYRQAAGERPSAIEPLVFLGDLYGSAGEHTLALQAYESAVERAAGKGSQGWAYISLGNAHAALGDEEQAIEAYRKAARRAFKRAEDEVYLQDARPALLAPGDLCRITHPVWVSLDDRTYILGYDVEPAQAIPGEPIRLTLYWWSMEDAPQWGTVSLGWLTATGEKVGPEQSTRMFWDPGHFVRWSYEVMVPEDAPVGQSLRIRVRVSPEAAEGSETLQAQVSGSPFGSIPVGRGE